MQAALRGFGLGVQRLRAALTALSAALLASYFVLVLLQVFFRYILNESLFWAEELVRGLMVWGVMVSSALVAASRDHIRVEVLELMLPPTGRRIVVRIANVRLLDPDGIGTCTSNQAKDHFCSSVGMGKFLVGEVFEQEGNSVVMRRIGHAVNSDGQRVVLRVGLDIAA